MHSAHHRGDKCNRRSIPGWAAFCLGCLAIIAALAGSEMGITPNGIVYTYKEQVRKGYTVEPTTFRTLRKKGK